MRYIIFAITILILMLSVGIAHADTWRPPATCDDDRREIKGNRTSPCKFPTPELENIEYRVRMEYPKCYGELRFYVKGIAPLPSEYIFLGISIYEYKERGYQKTLYGSEWRNRPTRNQTIHDGFIVGPGGPYPGRWDVRSQMPTESVSKAEAGTPVFAGIWIQDSAHGKNWAYYSNVIPYPQPPRPRRDS